MEGAFAPWHIVIIGLLLLVFFGGKKLPESARSLGQALRIFKAETRGLRQPDPPPASAVPTAPAAATTPAAPVPGVAPTAPVAASAPVAPVPAPDASVLRP